MTDKATHKSEQDNALEAYWGIGGMPDTITLECPYCGSTCTECLVCPTCHETKGLECCMSAGVGCPCIACEESEEYIPTLEEEG